MKISQLIAAAILAVPAVSPSTATATPMSVSLDERGRPLLPPALAQAIDGLTYPRPDSDDKSFNIICNCSCKENPA